MKQNYAVHLTSAVGNALLIALFAVTFLFPSGSKAAWNYTLSSPSPNSIPVGYVCASAIRAPIYYFTIAAAGSGGGAASMSSFTFTTNAGYSAASLVNLTLYRHNVNNLAGAVTVLSTTLSLGPGSHTLSFTAFSLNVAQTYHFWVAMDIVGAPTLGNQVSVPAINWSNFGISGGTLNPCTGCTSPGAVQTIVGITAQPTASPSPICSGGTTTLSMSASSGPAWTYQWIDVPTGLPVTNGTPVGATYSPNGSPTLTVFGLTANRQYRCLIGGPCSITSNPVTVVINAPTAVPPLTIYALDAIGSPIPSNPTICQFTQVDFFVNAPFINLSPNTFTWKVNGVPMLVQNNVVSYLASTTSFSTSSLANNDIVTLEVNWPGGCVSVNPRISQSEQFTVTPNQPPLVSVTHNFPTDTICRGNQVTFTALPTEAGTPSYQWFLDGNPVGTASTYITLPTLAVGNHNIWCTIASSEPCDSTAPVFNNTATSATTTLVVNPCYFYVPFTGTLGPYYSCGSPFYDSALDLAVPYSSNANGVVKICPAIASQYVTISFTSINLNDAGDRLRIFSGTPVSTITADTSGTPLFNLAGFTSSAGCGSVVTSNVSGGCLTSHFKSDGGGTAAGWVANVTCSPTPSPGPLPGSTCGNPTVITALPYSVTSHTTQCYGSDYQLQSGICNTTYNGEDRVYTYTATGPECTSITLSGTTGTPTLSVYTGCPGSAGTACITPTPQSGNSTAQVTFPSAGTYYIIVDEAGGATAFSSYNLSIQSFGLAPANDLPCNAQFLDLLVNANGNNSCTGSASEPGNPSCWTGGTLNTAWYSFIAPATPNPSAVHIRTTPGTITETQIALYSGNCSSLTMIACNQAGPSCASTPNPASSDIIYSNLVPGALYYIRVDGRNNNTGNYSIIVADVNGIQQPYSDGQDCVVPMTLCNSVFQVGDPGFVSTGWVCDFGTINNTCMFAGERSSAWYVFTTNGAGNLSWLLTPNGAVYVDYDWILMDITSFGPDQATRVANACPQINANNLPWVRCNISDVILFAPCATSQYQTGMCPSSTVTSTTPFGPSFCSSLPVVANQTFLLKLSNWTNNQRGFTIDFNAFGVSPIAYSNPPSVLYWTAGANNTDWFNPVNWGNCGPPNCNTTAIITTGSSFMPVINAPGAVCRDLDIKAGASVTINAGIQLDVCRNYVNNGTLNAAPTSTVRVMGTGAQFFDGNMIGSSVFGNLWMNKSSNHMTILDHANVAGNLTLGTLTGGKIITGTKTLYVTNSAPGSVSSGGPGSFVQGNLKRNLSGTAGTYYWPVGTALKGFQLAAVDFYGTHSIGNILSYFTDTPIPIQPGPIGPECPTNDFSTMAPLNNGYWTLTANANASSANYKMTLFNLNYTNTGGSNAWTVLKANTAAGPWTLSGNCIASTAVATARDNMSGFSVFTSGQSLPPLLPVDLLNFNAVVDGEDVLTTWTTATEINNDYFVIERSHDGVTFVEIGTKKGSGNSSVTLYYSMLDTEPFKGISYYRLRQVDFDGTDSKSHLVAVSFMDNNVLTVFPNPASTANINLLFASAADGEVKLEFIDMLGKIHGSELLRVKKGLNEIRDYNVGDLPHGVYFIKLKPVGTAIVEPMQTRFVKQMGER